MTRILIGLCLTVLLVLSGLGTAQIPSMINYQGILMNQDGQPVADGQYMLTFRMYDQSNNEIWLEEHPNVIVKNSYFHVILGSNAPLDLPFDQPYRLGIQVENEPELQPRMRLTSSAYALRARDAGFSEMVEGEHNIFPGSGEVGIGTRNPGADLEIYNDKDDFVGLDITNLHTGSNSSEGIYLNNEDGGIAGLRIYDDESVYASQMILFNNRPDGAIRLKTTGGSLTVANSGNIGVGTEMPSSKLTVDGEIRLLSSGIKFPDGTTQTTAAPMVSGRRYKTDIRTFPDALETVSALRGVSFTWKEDDRPSIGVIAEEVGEVLPEVVVYEDNGIDARAVNYQALIGVLIEAVKEQQREISELKEKIE
jgi:hypothetical protein